MYEGLGVTYFDMITSTKWPWAKKDESSVNKMTVTNGSLRSDSQGMVLLLLNIPNLLGTFVNQRA